MRDNRVSEQISKHIQQFLSFVKTRPYQVLYTVVLVELLVTALVQLYVTAVGIVILVVIALVTRAFRDAWEIQQQSVEKEAGQKHDWIKTRGFLEKILISGNILPVSERITDKNELDLTIDDISQIRNQLTSLKPETIKILRTIGIDGVLICMFLLQQSPAYCSVKIIQKSLDIPLTTVYRAMQRLEECKQVYSHYVLDTPNKAYYAITPGGQSTILDLYEFLGGNEFFFTGKSNFGQE